MNGLTLFCNQTSNAVGLNQMGTKILHIFIL